MFSILVQEQVSEYGFLLSKVQGNSDDKYNAMASGAQPVNAIAVEQSQGVSYVRTFLEAENRWGPSFIVTENPTDGISSRSENPTQTQQFFRILNLCRVDAVGSSLKRREISFFTGFEAYSPIQNRGRIFFIRGAL